MPYTITNYDELYANIGNARKAALDAAMLDQQQQLAGQQNALAGQYNDVRSQAYTGNRVSALGNNERLAAMGLAGNAYAAPQSGYSESSRVAQDTALQNALNAATRQQQAASDALTLQGNSARLNRDQQLASTMADLEGQKIAAKTQQDQFAANYNMQEAQNALQQDNWNKTFAYNQGRDAINDQRYTDETNYAHGRDAVADNQWNQTFEFNKAQAARSGGGGGSNNQAFIEAWLNANDPNGDYKFTNKMKGAAANTKLNTQAASVTNTLNPFYGSNNTALQAQAVAAAKAKAEANAKAAKATKEKNDWYLKGYR